MVVCVVQKIDRAARQSLQLWTLNFDKHMLISESEITSKSLFFREVLSSTHGFLTAGQLVITREDDGPEAEHAPMKSGSARDI